MDSTKSAVGDRLLSAEELATALGYCGATVRQWVRSGRIVPTHRFGPRSCRFRLDDIIGQLTSDGVAEDGGDCREEPTR